MGYSRGFVPELSLSGGVVSEATLGVARRKSTKLVDKTDKILTYAKKTPYFKPNVDKVLCAMKRHETYEKIVINFIRLTLVDNF